MLSKKSYFQVLLIDETFWRKLHVKDKVQVPIYVVVLIVAHALILQTLHCP